MYHWYGMINFHKMCKDLVLTLTESYSRGIYAHSPCIVTGKKDRLLNMITIVTNLTSPQGWFWLNLFYGLTTNF